LEVVGTPIGNLGDLSPRARTVLAEVPVIFCEDTRRTRALLSAIGVRAPRLVRLDRHREKEALEEALELLRAQGRAAYVSDAGMPAVSDPGAALVASAARAGVEVRVVPGPDSVSAALAVSGFVSDGFRFVGFLPRKGGERTKALAAVAACAQTQVIFESARRLVGTLAEMAGACGAERALAACQELTKVHERVWRGDLASVRRALEALEVLKGEWVLVLGPDQSPPAAPPLDDRAVVDLLAERLEADRESNPNAVVAEVAKQLGLPKRRVYELSLSVREARSNGARRP